jgi:hypothetical protein
VDNDGEIYYTRYVCTLNICFHLLFDLVPQRSREKCLPAPA